MFSANNVEQGDLDQTPNNKTWDFGVCFCVLGVTIFQKYNRAVLFSGSIVCGYVLQENVIIFSSALSPHVPLFLSFEKI